MSIRDENGILIVENLSETLKSYKANRVGGKRLTDARLFQPFDTIPGLVQHLSFYCPEFFSSEHNAEYVGVMRQEPMFSLSIGDESAPQDMHWHNYTWEIYIFTQVDGVASFLWQERLVDAKGDLAAGNWSRHYITSPGQLLVVRPGYCHFLDLKQVKMLMITIQVPPSRTNLHATLETKNPMKIAGGACPQHSCDFRPKCIALQKDARAKRPFSPK